MRLHQLDVTAFGPFATAQHVDFDHLTRAGLFLLHGPTGAGKSSLLDAVCFALYGRVPGLRGAGARLRSDHAAPDVSPSVRLEFSVGGRRLEVTRAPEWQRPKKRGEGTVREPARVVLREFVDGAWVGLTHRIDEAGERIGELVGLGPDQFTKLVLLPQGDFAAFLHAGADERRALLQRLFGTERFTAVEAWLVARRRELRGRLEEDRAATDRLLSRAEEALAAFPESPADPSVPVKELAAWAHGRLIPLREAATTARTAYETAAEQHRTAAERAARAAQHAELGARLDALVAAEGAQQEAEGRITAARAASVLAPVLGRLTELDAARAAAVSRVEALGVQDDADPDPVRAELAALDDLARVEAELLTLAERHSGHRSDLVMAEQAHQRADEDLAGLDARQNTARTGLAVARELAGALADRQASAERAREVAAAVVLAETLTAEHVSASDGVRAAVDELQAAVGHALDLRARRLAGMAAELAVGLADGEPCAVCGALEHPSPARAGAASVTEAAEHAAAQAQAGAERRRQSAEQALAAVAERRAAVLERTGGRDASQAADELRSAQAALAASEQAVTTAASLTDELAELDRLVTAARERRTGAVQAVQTTRVALAEVASRIQALRGPVDDARGDDASLAARGARLREHLSALETGAAARAERDAAEHRHAEQVETATRAATGAGFDDLTAAGTAFLRPADLAALERAAAAYREESATVRARLAALGPPEDAVEALAPQILVAATDLAETTARDHALAVQSARALAGIAQQHERQVRAGAPLRERFAVLESVSRCVEGSGGDNQLRMRLSSYVLAARLEEVAAAASIRLAEMSGGRFTLAHTDGPARGGARSGLGLAVVDAWSGTPRDPATLSGGETFCTALALALGLADVVQAESGGAMIETLLVDEGFGSLDAETLDEVMDVLDGLRSGGRAVGLVSHVADLQDRIPARLQVVKTRAGSHLVA